MEAVFSIDDLPRIVTEFWASAKGARVFAFHGSMGAGKTTIISALCHGLGITDAVGSPTFSIINEYRLPGGDTLFHMDLYRLKDEEEVIAAGVEDCMYSGSICFVEWPEIAPRLFDEATVHVYLTTLPGGERKLEMKPAVVN